MPTVKQPKDDEEEDADADAPRVSQWVEDDDDFLAQESESEEEKEEKGIPAEKTLKNNLHDLPLGALRQAQRILSQAEPESDSESGSDSGDGESASGSDDAPPAKPRTDISKRSSKHAPIEVTSKRPVTRKRTVVEVPKISSLRKIPKSYGFLSDNHKNELATLRETLKQARKLLASSPRELRSEREHEVYRLEQAVKRAESMVNRDRLDQVQRDALSKVKKEELEKRSHGKGEWYLKRGEKQKLVVEARYEASPSRKAIEKKQKKESQKEKRSRPYAKGEFSGSREERPAKRRRV
ncbi:hypothetical protein BDZ97DRAFT_1905681 [Flammula alnicola]|nr:hypothetical protein BDZ97DRAFT_1905681 [Flammula alnicola]